MTFLDGLGYMTCDQELLAPVIDRAITACVIGVVAKQGSPEDAVAAVIKWLKYGENAGRIALDFPREDELMAACVVEAFRRYLRHNNSTDLPASHALRRLGRVATGKNLNDGASCVVASGAGK